MTKIKVSVYEDNNSLRKSLCRLIAGNSDFSLAGEYSNANDVIENTAVNQPDVILMDIDMPGISGIEAVTLIKSRYPKIKVIMQTVFDDNEGIFRSICAGAVGYILKRKSAAGILEAIKEGYNGGAPITPSIALKILSMFKTHATPVNDAAIDLSEREREVLRNLTRGLSYKMIAGACDISLDTVRHHIRNIYTKLHVHSMTEAVAKALKEGLV